MGYELDRLMAHYGVSTPSLTFAGSPDSEEDLSKYEEYKKEYQRRIAARNVYDLLYGSPSPLAALKPPQYNAPPKPAVPVSPVVTPAQTSPYGDSSGGGGGSDYSGFLPSGAQGADAQRSNFFYDDTGTLRQVETPFGPYTRADIAGMAANLLTPLPMQAVSYLTTGQSVGTNLKSGMTPVEDRSILSPYASGLIATPGIPGMEGISSLPASGGVMGSTDFAGNQGIGGTEAGGLGDVGAGGSAGPSGGSTDSAGNQGIGGSEAGGLGDAGYGGSDSGGYSGGSSDSGGYSGGNDSGMWARGGLAKLKRFGKGGLNEVDEEARRRWMSYAPLEAQTEAAPAEPTMPYTRPDMPVIRYDYSDLNSILPSALSRQMSPSLAASDSDAAAPELVRPVGLERPPYALTAPVEEPAPELPASLERPPYTAMSPVLVEESLAGLERPPYADTVPVQTSVAEAPTLESMLARYRIGTPEESTYAKELAAARAAAKQETDAFYKMLNRAIAEPSEKPNKAEMYFRLAAAFGTPGKTGSFGEGLAQASASMAEQMKEEKQTRRTERERRLALGLEAQKARMASAKEDVTALRSLTAEEMRDKRTIATELLKDWVKRNDPVSSAGKQAQDEGLKPGTTEYQKRVREISDLAVDRQMAQINATVAGMSAQMANLALAQSREQRAKDEAARLTPAEVKLKTETEDLVASANSAMSVLRQAYKLNPNTFDTSVKDTAQRKVLEAAGSKDPKLLATRQMENLLAEQALEKLKATFGAAPTEGERKILLDLQGIGAKSIEERAAIMKQAFTSLQRAQERHQKRLNEINQGLYRNVKPAEGGLD